MVASDTSEALGEIGSASVQLFCNLGRVRNLQLLQLQRERREVQLNCVFFFCLYKV